jgi:hypothetical protein
MAAVFVVGAAVVAYGWLSDREANRRRREDVPIGEGCPARVDASVLLAADGALAEAAVFAAGLADKAFANDPERGRMVLADAAVLVCEDEVAGLRELSGTVAAAAGRALVVAAPAFGGDCLLDLAVNAAAGRFRGGAVRVQGADELARLAAATGAEPVRAADLKAGLSPTLGACRFWVGGAEQSQVVL